jgi:TPP-dependent pyruvate/acetoin dehydrogenase alpha subunit
LLRERGLLDDERVASTRQDAEDLMRAGIAAAEAEAPPDPELLFANAYVNPPGNMRNG